MPFSLVVEPHEDVIIMQPTGSTTVENMLRLVAQVDETLKRHDTRAVLFDCVRMYGGMSLSELHVVGDRFAELARRTGVRLAAVNTPAEWHDNRFSEDVMANRGAVLRHFSARQEALDWLSAKRTVPKDQPEWAQANRRGP